MSDPVVLENKTLRAVIAPEKGASMMGLFARRGKTWLPLMPDILGGKTDLEWCNFLMVPYSNRIENGRFTFAGKPYQLQNAEKHAMHGDVRRRPWCAEDRTDTYVRCDFQSKAHENMNWPWPFEARAEYDVMDEVFSMRLTLWNRGESPMPAGFGWHPYFSRHLTKPGEPVTITMDVFGMYPDVHDNRIPSGPAAPPPPELDFSEGKALPHDRAFDYCACGYDGEGSIEWPESAVKILFDCSLDLGHLVLYNPIEKPYFCVEPVANATNGVNLLAKGDPTAGTVVLEPDESLTARFDLKIELG